jgi:hypothetical protein
MRPIKSSRLAVIQASDNLGSGFIGDHPRHLLAVVAVLLALGAPVQRDNSHPCRGLCRRSTLSTTVNLDYRESTIRT